MSISDAGHRKWKRIQITPNFPEPLPKTAHLLSYSVFRDKRIPTAIFAFHRIFFTSRRRSNFKPPAPKRTRPPKSAEISRNRSPLSLFRALSNTLHPRTLPVHNTGRTSRRPPAHAHTRTRNKTDERLTLSASCGWLVRSATGSRRQRRTAISARMAPSGRGASRAGGGKNWDFRGEGEGERGEGRGSRIWFAQGFPGAEVESGLVLGGGHFLLLI